MTSETTPESSPSLATGFFAPEFQRECCVADDKALDERALDAAKALMKVADVLRWYPQSEYIQGGEHHLRASEIAAILRPFLEPKPTKI